MVEQLNNQHNQHQQPKTNTIIMKIKTNHHYRPVLYWNDLTDAEQAEHQDDYGAVHHSRFFRYQNCLYDLNHFLRVNDALNGRGQDHSLYGWDGYKNESFFSSVVVKYGEDGETVKVGLALS